MKDYLIFHYRITNQDYVEAYPMHFDMSNYTLVVPNQAIVCSPSRNAARKAAYTNWIRSDGMGFNALPYRVYT